MEADGRCKLYHILTCSYPHLRSFNRLPLRAEFKATKDLHFKGLPENYFVYSMTRMQGSLYLMRLYNGDTGGHESYCTDVDTLIATRLMLNIGNATNSSFVDGQLLIVMRYGQPMVILRDLQVIGEVVFDIKHEYCKNGHFIRGRYAQEGSHSVYAVDRHTGLYRIEWREIKDDKYVKTLKTLLQTNVKNFYVDVILGLATLNMDNILTLPSKTIVDLKAKVNYEATWTIVTCIAECWIVCGEQNLEGRAIMVRVNNQGNIRSTL